MAGRYPAGVRTRDVPALSALPHNGPAGARPPRTTRRTEACSRTGHICEAGAPAVMDAAVTARTLSGRDEPTRSGDIPDSSCRGRRVTELGDRGPRPASRKPGCRIRAPEIG